MAQYKLGTISITNGTNVVTGVATQFLANVAVGNSFKVYGVNALYSIIAVDSDTQIRISPNYAGTTVAGAQYQISTSFTPNLGLAEIETGDSEFAFHLTHEVIRKLDAAIPDYTTALAGKSPLAGPGSGQAFSVGALSATIGQFTSLVYLDGGYSAGIGSTGTGHGQSLVVKASIANTATEVARWNTSGNLLINTPTDNGSGAKLQVNGKITATSGIEFSANHTPAMLNNYTVSFQVSDNTHLAVLMKGSDGVTRSVMLTLA